MSAKVRIAPPSAHWNSESASMEETRAPGSRKKTDFLTWFNENFSPPSHVLPVDDTTGDVIWPNNLERLTARGAMNQLTRHPRFKDYAREIDNTVKFIESNYSSKYWAPSSWRFITLPAGAPGVSQPDDVHSVRSTIVETILQPRRALPWTVHATFVPGDINAELGIELGDLAESFTPLETRRRKFRNLRAMLVQLHRQALESKGQSPVDLAISTAAIEWIRTLKSDDELLVDNRIVIHHSPPSWLPLDRLGPAGDGAAITGILIASESFSNAAILMLAYGGSRIFLRLVRNSNLVQDAFFERVQRRIRRGDWMPNKREND